MPKQWYLKAARLLKILYKKIVNIAMLRFKAIMVTKSVKNTGVVGSVKSEVPIEVSGEYFNYCPKCRRRLN